MYLTPDTALGAALCPATHASMCYRAMNGTVVCLKTMKGDEEVQWPLGSTIREAHVQCPLAPLGRLLCNRLPGSGRHKVLNSRAAQSNPTSRSRLRTNPVVCRSGMPNRTFSPSQDIASHALPGNGRTSLNGRVTELLLPTAFATRLRRPNHLRIKPDR